MSKKSFSDSGNNHFLKYPALLTLVNWKKMTLNVGKSSPIKVSMVEFKKKDLLFKVKPLGWGTRRFNNPIDFLYVAKILTTTIISKKT